MSFLLDIIKHLYPGVAHGVFPVAGGDNSSYFTGDTTIREVFAVHNDFGVAQCLDDRVCAQRAF